MNEWIPVEPRTVQPRTVQPQLVRGFWRRQFVGAPTSAQLSFDVAFGLVLPFLCYYFDPIVFRSSSEYDMGLYPQVQFYAYTISALEMVALCAWLSGAVRAGRGAAALTGVLLAGAIFSFVVGVAILPYSLLGLIIFIGALGFIPFLTSLVYLRNAWRAAGAAGHADQGLRSLAAAVMVCGFFFALCLPMVVRILE